MNPRRTLPPALSIRTLFGGFVGQFGWMFAAFGMLFVWVFDAGSSATEWMRFRGEVAQVPGVSTGWESTNLSVNEVRVYRTTFSYEVDGRAFEGASYGSGRWIEAGQPVTVEYVSDDPSISRAEGLRTSQGGGGVFFVFVFPVVGLGIALGSLARRLRIRELLTTGVVTRGTLVSTEATSSSVNNQPVMKLTFEFEPVDGGGLHHATAKTHKTFALEDEEHELLVYDPRDPGRAAMLDELPCQPRVNEAGGFEASVPGLPTPLYLLLPGVTVLTVLRYVTTLF